MGVFFFKMLPLFLCGYKKGETVMRAREIGIVHLLARRREATSEATSEAEKSAPNKHAIGASAIVDIKEFDCDEIPGNFFGVNCGARAREAASALPAPLRNVLRAVVGFHTGPLQVWQTTLPLKLSIALYPKTSIHFNSCLVVKYFCSEVKLD